MDSEIRKILDEPEGNTPRDHLELAVGAGGKVWIAGHEFPAPAAAVIAMLELIKSPFVDGDIEREIDDMDVFRALYLFSERDKAVSPILRWMRREEALDRLKNQFNAEKYPHVALIVAEQLKGVADAQAEFDAAAMRFAESLGAFHIADAASEIGTYLALAGGFSMLPDNGGSKKKGCFDLDFLTAVTAMVASIVPGVTPHQAMWEIPFVTVSYYMVQAARRAGVKGIGRHEKSIKLWRRFAELHKEELDAEKKRRGLTETV